MFIVRVTLGVVALALVAATVLLPRPTREKWIPFGQPAANALARLDADMREDFEARINFCRYGFFVVCRVSPEAIAGCEKLKEIGALDATMQNRLERYASESEGALRYAAPGNLCKIFLVSGVSQPPWPNREWRPLPRLVLTFKLEEEREHDVLRMQEQLKDNGYGSTLRDKVGVLDPHGIIERHRGKNTVTKDDNAPAPAPGTGVGIGVPSARLEPRSPPPPRLREESYGRRSPPFEASLFGWIKRSAAQVDTVCDPPPSQGSYECREATLVSLGILDATWFALSQVYAKGAGWLMAISIIVLLCKLLRPRLLWINLPDRFKFHYYIAVPAISVGTIAIYVLVAKTTVEYLELLVGMATAGAFVALSSVWWLTELIWRTIIKPELSQ